MYLKAGLDPGLDEPETGETPDMYFGKAGLIPAKDKLALMAVICFHLKEKERWLPPKRGLRGWKEKWRVFARSWNQWRRLDGNQGIGAIQRMLLFYQEEVGL